MANASCARCVTVVPVSRSTAYSPMNALCACSSPARRCSTVEMEGGLASADLGAPAANAASAAPPIRTPRRDNRCIAPDYRSACDAPKRLWQRLFRSLWAQDGGAVGAGQQWVRDGIDFLEGDAFDLGEGLRDAAVFTVVELAAADAVHPRPGILQPEHQPAAQRSLGDSAFRFGDAVARHLLEHFGGHPDHFVESLGLARGVDRQRPSVGE